MKKRHAKDIFQSSIVITLSLLFILMQSGAGLAKSSRSAGPPFPFPGGKRGQVAIESMKDRLPAVASRYGKSPEKLKKLFLQDNDLWLDPGENLLYLCSFDASESEALPESPEAAIPQGPFPLAQTFKLHSLAGASKVIYLDFDGHITSGTYWNGYNGGADIISAPYDFNGNSGSFSEAELNRIQNIWARVAEDFAIYNIDVTTEDPGIEALRRSSSSDENFGVRIVISPTSSWYGSAGGVAYVGSFAWSSDTPAFVFSSNLANGNEKYVTDAASHETGHTLGLSHDGVTGGTAYYRGHGSWAPIMGVAYNKAISHWSKGEYTDASNKEDDLAVMLNYGASFRPDDHGDWIDNATMLSGDTLDAAGIIERNGDLDAFGFQTEAGTIAITIEPATIDPNLDIMVQVLDDGGNLIGEDDEYYILPASLNLNLPAGTYYILVDGVGTGDPDTGYSDYASAGQYFIAATLPATQSLPAAPTALAAVPLSASQVNLGWTDNSINESGFSIERSPNGVDSWTEIGFSAADSSSYTDSGLTQNTTYHYRVAAYNVIGSSGFSNTANAVTFGLPPAAPSSLDAAAVAPGQIDLFWTDNAGNENGFVIERSPNGVNSWVEIASVADNATSYQDTGLAPGTTFFYRVAAYNTNGNSAFSNTSSAATPEVPPTGPTNLLAMAVSASQIDLSWQDNSANEAGFKVERSADGYEPWTEITVLPSNSSNFSDTPLSPGTTVYYRAYSFNSAGSSGPSNTAVATTEEQPQFIDQAAVQEAAMAGSASGSFVDTRVNDSVTEILTEQTSGGRPQKRYSFLEHKWMFQVQAGTSITLFANVWAPVSTEGDTFVFSYSTDDENYIDMFTVSADSDDNIYQLYPLPAHFSGTVYIRVTDTLRSAGNYDRDTLYLDHLFIRTDNEQGSLPPGPSGLTVDHVTSSSITINWQDNADNEFGFLVERSPDGLNWEQAGTTGPDAVAFTDGGLPPGETFFYRVQAFNSAGVSAYSGTIGAGTTQADSLHIDGLRADAELLRSRWKAHATITVHDQNGAPVAGATVEGAWGTGGNSSCSTDNAGQCTVSTARLKTSVTSINFRVTGLALNGYIYDPDANVITAVDVSSP